jgi:hypothetical protein
MKSHELASRWRGDCLYPAVKQVEVVSSNHRRRDRNPAMKDLVRNLCAVVLASQAAGCVIESGFEIATIEARWTFVDEATDLTTGCPAGFDTVALNSQPIDDFGPIGPVTIDLFDCGDRVGASALEPAVYQTWIDVTDFNNTALYAQSLSAVVDVIETDKTFDASIVNDGGYFKYEWELVGEQSNQRLACSDVDGLDTIESIGTSISSAENVAADQFPCDDHVGVTGSFLQGAYTVSITALANDRALGEPVALTNRAIRDRNRVTELGLVNIPIAGR